MKKWFENLPIDKNPDYVVYFDDFDRIGFDSNTGHRWTVVKDSGASVAIAADQLNGLVNLNSTATTDNDGASIQKNEIFQVQSNKDLWFETKVRTSDVTDTDLCFGFTINFATNPEAMLQQQTELCFKKMMVMHQFFVKQKKMVQKHQQILVLTWKTILMSH